MLPQILISLWDKLLTMELMPWHPLHHQPLMTFKKNTNKSFLECKISEYHKKSYSKHTLLSTAIATKLFQDYLTKTQFTINSVWFLFFLFLSLPLLLSLLFLHYFSSFSTFGKGPYHKNYFFCLIVRWIVAKIRF